MLCHGGDPRHCPGKTDGRCITLLAPECRPAQTAVEKLTGLLDGEQARKFVAWEANLPEVADARGPVAERDAPF